MSYEARTGPLGRVLRLVLAAVSAAALASIVDARGSARFHNPHILSEPLAWLLQGLMLLVFVLLVGAVSSAFVGPRTVSRIQVAAVALLALAIAVAGWWGGIAFGSVWGYPVADLVWWFDVSMLVVELVTALAAVVLGTPGCEIGVAWRLLVRIRGTSPPAAEPWVPCVLGLHLVDEWEARRAQR